MGGLLMRHSWSLQVLLVLSCWEVLYLSQLCGAAAGGAEAQALVFLPALIGFGDPMAPFGGAPWTCKLSSILLAAP